MNQKTYFQFSAAIFFVVAMVHLGRLLTGWEIVIGTWIIPHWISFPGLIVPAALSVWGFRLASHAGTRRKYTA
jgi:hypothetical protein